MSQRYCLEWEEQEVCEKVQLWKIQPKSEILKKGNKLWMIENHNELKSLLL